MYQDVFYVGDMPATHQSIILSEFPETESDNINQLASVSLSSLIEVFCTNS